MKIIVQGGRLWTSVALLLACPVAGQAQWNYTVNNGAITVTRYTEHTGGAVSIPGTFASLPVTSIGDAGTITLLPGTRIETSVFEDNAAVTSVTIPDTTTNIRYTAFYGCASLTAISVSSTNSVFASSGGILFDSTTNTLVQYPGGKAGSYSLFNGVTSIGDAAFLGCAGLTSVTIPFTVTSIGGNAFYGCTNLATITASSTNPVFSSSSGVLFDKTQTTLIQYPGGKAGSYSLFNGVTSIGDAAFMGCAGLTSVTIPFTVASIGNGAFQDCANLTAINVNSSNAVYASSGGVLFDSTTNALIQYPGGKAGSYSLLNGVTNIGDAAFLGCAGLTSVTIPFSVSSIGSAAFYNCANLTAINVSSTNPVFQGVNGVLFDENQTTLIQYPAGKTGSYTITNTVTRIGDWAFAKCAGLAAITIPDSVTNIGDWAFSECTGLTSIVIPDGVTRIGDAAFYGCTNLASVTIPDSVTSIGKAAFYGCADFPVLTIPSSVTNIGDEAFENCDLTAVYFEGSIPGLGVSVFDYNNSTGYYLPGTAGWGTFTGLPLVSWNPQAANDNNFGVRSNKFGFTITGTSNLVIVVDACTNLINAVWSPMTTVTLTSASSYFSDAQWTNHPVRFYGFQMP